MNEGIKIEHPWIIIHQPGGGGQPIRTLLGGPTGATYEEFAIVVCDLIRHIAAGFKVSENDVFEWVERERKNPTSPIETVWERPSGNA